MHSGLVILGLVGVILATGVSGSPLWIKTEKKAVAEQQDVNNENTGGLELETRETEKEGKNSESENEVENSETEEGETSEADEGDNSEAENEGENSEAEDEGENSEAEEGETSEAENEGENSEAENEGETSKDENEGENSEAEEGETSEAEEGETSEAENEGETSEAEDEGENNEAENEGENSEAENEVQNGVAKGKNPNKPKREAEKRAAMRGEAEVEKRRDQIKPFGAAKATVNKRNCPDELCQRSLENALIEKRRNRVIVSAKRDLKKRGFGVVPPGYLEATETAKREQVMLDLEKKGWALGVHRMEKEAETEKQTAKRGQVVQPIVAAEIETRNKKVAAKFDLEKRWRKPVAAKRNLEKRWRWSLPEKMMEGDCPEWPIVSLSKRCLQKRFGIWPAEVKKSSEFGKRQVVLPGGFGEAETPEASAEKREAEVVKRARTKQTARKTARKSSGAKINKRWGPGQPPSHPPTHVNKRGLEKRGIDGEAAC